MNSRRPQGEGPTGSPGYVWTDEPPDPTTFTLRLFQPSRNGNAGGLNTTQGQYRGRCCGQCFGNGDRPTYSGGLPAARPHPMTSHNQGRRTGIQG
jgi:hypothetical protein